MTTLGDPLATHSRAGLPSPALIVCCLIVFTACSMAGRPAEMPPSAQDPAMGPPADAPQIGPPASLPPLGALNQRQRGAWSHHSKAGREFLAVGKYREAEEEFVRAIGVAGAFGPSTQRLVTSVANLERVAHAYATSPLDLARITRVIIPAVEELHDPWHIEVGLHLSVLGQALVALGEFDEARVPLARAMEIMRAKRGDHSREVAQLLSQLAKLEWASGNLAGARLEFERAIEIEQRIGGADDPALIPTVSAYGQVLSQLEQSDEAEEALTWATRLSAEAGGIQHATTLNSLAWFYSENDRPADAVPVATRALAIIDDEPTFALTMEAVAILDTLGGALMKQQKYEAAETYLVRAYALFPNRTTPPFDQVRANYAQLLRATDRSEQALAIEAGETLEPAAEPAPAPPPAAEDVATSEEVAAEEPTADEATTGEAPRDEAAAEQTAASEVGSQSAGN